MHPLVRDLYRRFVHVGRDYPLGWSAIRDKVKQEFFKKKEIRDEVELKKAIKDGRYMVREMIGVIQMKKYRALNQRYTSPENQEALTELRQRYAHLFGDLDKHGSGLNSH